MSTFIPKKGDLFYYETRSFVEDETEIVLQRQIKRLQKVTHYYGSSCVNKCLAVDDHIILYVIVANPNNEEIVGEKRTSIKNKQIFYPVSPDIKEALGLLEGVDDSIPQLKNTEEKTF